MILYLFILVGAMSSSTLFTMDNEKANSSGFFVKSQSPSSPRFIISSDLLATNALESKNALQLFYHYTPIISEFSQKRSWLEKYITIPAHTMAIVKTGYEYARGTDPKKKGLSNSIDGVSFYLSLNSMTPLSDDEKAKALELSTQPEPNLDVINHIKEKAFLGLILATNQDVSEQACYQDQLRKKGIMIRDLFTQGIVTTPHYRLLEGKELSDDPFEKVGDKWLAAKGRIGSQEFEDTLLELSKDRKPIFLTGRKEYFKALQKSKKITAAYCPSPEKLREFLDETTTDYGSEYPFGEDWLEKK
ncbi:MAG TPA: hypothetical protein VHO47_05595 [Candidatus Babeliales bacterium]|nr:hypothetical protein [Candidatus Babeliales bacterium]